ncbi:unnamed protein product [Rhizoctonia solani]|uniref:MFS general substrate transporter n=1 Tax=Rhizoctonia solani TaxID=456999 RepID=A0A8H3B727_9AGAM|nr:unnamed protein product [Rhizoctonia solani]
MASEFQEPVPLQTLSRRGEQPTRTGTIAVSHTGSDHGDTGRDESHPLPEHEGISLPPVDKEFAAWSFVFAGFTLEALVWGFGFTYDVFQEYFLHHRTFGNASEAEIGAIGTTALAIQYFEALFVNMIAQQWRIGYDKTHNVVFPWTMLRRLTARKFRNQSIASHPITRHHVWNRRRGTICTMHNLCKSHLLVKFGHVLRASKLSEWFSTRRGLAAAIVFGGSGAGGACFPIAVNFLLGNFGFRWTLRIWAGFMLVFGALALAFTRPRLPVVRPPNADGPTLWTRLTRQHWGFLKSPPFICMSLVGQIIFGHACDIAPYQYVIVVSGAGAALSAYLLRGFAHSLGLIFAFAVVFGSLSGGFASVWPAASVDIAGSEQSVFLYAYGLLTMGKGLAAIIGPLMAAALYHPEQAEVGNTYSGYGFKDVTVFVGSMMATTAAGGVATRLAKRVV